MQVFTRIRNSGSEEVFRILVMNGLEPSDFPEASISLMFAVFLKVTENVNSICNTFNTYKDVIARKTCDEVPVLAIDGICPSENTVKNGTYPFISKVYVVIRSYLDHNSMVYKLYEWLQKRKRKIHDYRMWFSFRSYVCRYRGGMNRLQTSHQNVGEPQE